MTPYTQSNTVQGNCWQTCVACLLDVDPFTLPDQSLIESRAHGYYNNPLQGYLERHHGLAYCEIYGWNTQGIMVKPMHFGGHHLILGPTIRTPHNGGIHHCVIGRFGEMIWDVHPSRAGLTEVRSWGFLVSRDHPQLKENNHREKRRQEEGRLCDLNCWCPACGGVPQEWLEAHPPKPPRETEQA